MSLLRASRELALCGAVGLAFLSLVGCGSFDGQSSSEGAEVVAQQGQALIANPRKVAYWAAWASATTPQPADQIPWDKITHINVSFVGITPQYGCKFWTDYQRQDAEDTQAYTNTQALIDYRNDNHPNVKILLSLGGWTLSYRFSDAMSTDTNRNTLADSCISLINTLGADGLDIDWEYPTRLGATSGDGACHEGTCQRSTDPANLTAFLTKMRSKSGFSGKQLTAALRANRSGDPENIPYEYNNFFTGTPQRFDFVNLMTYDFHGGWESTVNFTAPYDKTTQAMDYARTQVGDTHKDKIVMGIPFYGPYWHSVNGEVPGTSTGTPLGTIAFRDAKAYVDAGNCTVKTPTSGNTQNRYLYCASAGGYNNVWISYDNTTVVGTKGDYVANNNYGGMMWWVGGQDSTANDLVNTIHNKMSSGGSCAGATVYQHTNYLGTAVCLPAGDYKLADLIARGVANDDVSSIKIPAGYTARIYQNDSYGGSVLIKRGDDATLVDDALGGGNWNDQLSSIKIVSCATAAVKVYQHASYGGYEACFNVGTYNTSDLIGHGAADNDITSLKVATGRSVTLWSGNTQTGSSLVRSASDSTLTDNAFPGGGSWNDQTSSFVVQ